MNKRLESRAANQVRHEQSSRQPLGKASVPFAILAWAAFATSVSTSSAAELRLPDIFGDHMVLQRDKPLKIWGWAEQGEAITVTFAGQTRTARAAEDGTWQVVLDPLPVSAIVPGTDLAASRRIQGTTTQVKERSDEASHLQEAAAP